MFTNVGLKQIANISLAKMGLFRISRELQVRLCTHGEWKCTHAQALQGKRRRLFMERERRVRRQE